MAKGASDEDIELFRNALDGVTRLEPDRVTPSRKRVAAIPVQRLADNKQVVRDLGYANPHWSENETGDELWYVRPGIQHKVLRKLKRGQFSIGDALDLHGKTAAEAHEALSEFLADCRTRGVRGVRIIHGKGLRSPGGKPVLKGKIDTWLRRRDEVIAFCSARPIDGGTGAIYVLLRR